MPPKEAGHDENDCHHSWLEEMGQETLSVHLSSLCSKCDYGPTAWDSGPPVPPGANQKYLSPAVSEIPALSRTA